MPKRSLWDHLAAAARGRRAVTPSLRLLEALESHAIAKREGWDDEMMSALAMDFIAESPVGNLTAEFNAWLRETAHWDRARQALKDEERED